MGNYEDRCDDIDFWSREITKKEAQISKRNPKTGRRVTGSKRRNILKRQIADLYEAIEQTRECGGIPEYEL